MQPALFPDLAGPAERLQRPPSEKNHGSRTQPAPAAPQPDQASNLAPGARVIRSGKLTVTLCPDGRVMLWLTTGTRGGAWLELWPADLAWLRGALAACVGSAGGEGG